MWLLLKLGETIQYCFLKSILVCQTEFGYHMPHFLLHELQSIGFNYILAQDGGRFDKVEDRTDEKRVRHEMVDTDKCSKQRK